jgi:predicted RNase H-like HicB family nuclease
MGPWESVLASGGLARKAPAAAAGGPAKDCAKRSPASAVLRDLELWVARASSQTCLPLHIQLPEDEGGAYLSQFPDLRGHMSDGETIAEAIKNGVDAMHGWMEAMRAAGHPIVHHAAPRQHEPLAGLAAAILRKTRDGLSHGVAIVPAERRRFGPPPVRPASTPRTGTPASAR